MSSAAAWLGTDGYIGTAGMPGVFAQAGMGYAYENDGVGFEQFAKVAYKNTYIRRSTAGPIPEGVQPRRDHGRVMSYPNTLLMCCPTGDGRWRPPCSFPAFVDAEEAQRP